MPGEPYALEELVPYHLPDPQFDFAIPRDEDDDEVHRKDYERYEDADDLSAIPSGYFH